MSYASKHNEANGEHNRDGMMENYSANYSVEGPTENTDIQRLRRRQMKNFIATLMLSRGVPMLLGGDEFGRRQDGNNNAYCQDNETSWYDWERLQIHGELHDFTRDMITLRKCYPVLSTEQFYHQNELVWFDSAGGYPDWDKPDRSLGCHILATASDENQLCLLFNAEEHSISFKLPGKRKWWVRVDTASEPSSVNMSDDEAATVRGGRTLVIGPRSLVLLTSGSL